MLPRVNKAEGLDVWNKNIIITVPNKLRNPIEANNFMVDKIAVFLKETAVSVANRFLFNL